MTRKVTNGDGTVIGSVKTPWWHLPIQLLLTGGVVLGAVTFGGDRQRLREIEKSNEATRVIVRKHIEKQLTLEQVRGVVSDEIRKADEERKRFRQEAEEDIRINDARTHELNGRVSRLEALHENGGQTP